MKHEDYNIMVRAERQEKQESDAFRIVWQKRRKLTSGKKSHFAFMILCSGNIEEISVFRCDLTSKLQARTRDK